MADFDGNTAYAKYDNFRIGNAATKYKLILGSYSGDAGNLKHNFVTINTIRCVKKTKTIRSALSNSGILYLFPYNSPNGLI